jgi:hypothetical protein
MKEPLTPEEIVADAVELIRVERGRGKSFNIIDDELFQAFPRITTEQLDQAYRTAAAQDLAEDAAAKRFRAQRKAGC